MDSFDDGERALMLGHFHGTILGVRGLWHFHVRAVNGRLTWIVNGKNVHESASPAHAASVSVLLRNIVAGQPSEANVEQAV